MRLVNDTGCDIEKISVSSEKMAYLIELVANGKINRHAYRETIDAVFLHDANPKDYISEKGLFVVSDDGIITQAVEQTLAENPSAISDFKSGKEKALAFLMGQTMKNLSGKGDPVLVKRILLRVLNV